MSIDGSHICQCGRKCSQAPEERGTGQKEKPYEFVTKEEIFFWRETCQAGSSMREVVDLAERLFAERDAFREAAIKYKHEANGYNYENTTRLGYAQELDAEAKGLLTERSLKLTMTKGKTEQKGGEGAW